MWKIVGCFAKTDIDRTSASIRQTLEHGSELGKHGENSYLDIQLLVFGHS